MNDRIADLVDLYFADIPYSNDLNIVRERIVAALNKEYQAYMNEDKSPDEAFESLVGQYGKLENMAKLAGYTEDEYAAWKTDEKTGDITQTKKEMRKQGRRVYALGICGIAVVIELFWLIYDFIYDPIWSLAVFVVIGIMACVMFFIIRGFVRTEKARREKYDEKAYKYLRDLSDRYIKRRFNGIVISVFAVMTFVLLMITTVVFSKTKPSEMVEVTFPSLALLEIPMFICIKNRLCFDAVYRRIKLPEKHRYNKHLIGVCTFLAGYCTVTFIILLCIERSSVLYWNFVLGAALLFALFYVVYILVFRKRITYKNVKLNRKRVSIVTAVAVTFTGLSIIRRDTWYTQPYINSIAVVEHNDHDISYDEKSGVYTITASTDDFKILHLTDIHLGGSLFSYRKDLKALEAVYAEIEYAKPDFVIVTGDLCFPLGIMSLSLNNSAPVYQFAAFMRNIDIPWAFTYGNHDTEEIATVSKRDLNDVYKSLSFKTSGNLLYPYVQAPINGRNNQLIELRRSDGSFNTALFLIDSNAYTGLGINDYDYIHPDQVDWYADNVRALNAREGRIVPSMAFFHIPLQEYRTAYDLYMQGSDEVEYFFGENNEKGKKICCSDYPSNLFDTMVELQSTTAVFCGHDHYNNMSLEYKGIRLTYGMSIDYLAMPGIENDVDQRGAELITIHSDSTWDLVQLPLKEIQSV